MKSAMTAIRNSGWGFFNKKTRAAARPLFLRGLAMHDNLIFAGFSPATIVCVDKASGEVLDYYFHSTDVRVCVHGLTVDA